MDVQQLETINFTNFRVPKITNMSYMFYNCKHLIVFDLTGFDTSNVIDMSYTFYFAGNLKSLNLSGWDTSKVTNKSHMFSFSGNLLPSLDLTSFDTSNVVAMSYMFYQFHSNGLTIDLSGFDTSKVTNMVGMFEDSSGFEILNLSNFDFSKVNNMSGMFENTQIYFLNIKDIKTKDSLINLINNLEDKETMYLCLNDANLIQKIDKSIFICCEIQEEENYIYDCDSSNYFSVYFETTVKYNSGFRNDDSNQIYF